MKVEVKVLLSKLIVIAVAGGLSACVSTGPGPGLPGPDSAVAVFYSPLPVESCTTGHVGLGVYDPASKAWRETQRVPSPNIGRSGGDAPHVVSLAPGRYGIMAFYCENLDLRERTNFHYSFHPALHSAADWSSSDSFDAPLAWFELRAGEVVDIGSIRVDSSSPLTFNVKIGPLPAAARSDFTRSRPDLSAVMVSRTMRQ